MEDVNLDAVDFKQEIHKLVKQWKLKLPGLPNLKQVKSSKKQYKRKAKNLGA